MRHFMTVLILLLLSSCQGSESPETPSATPQTTYVAPGQSSYAPAGPYPTDNYSQRADISVEINGSNQPNLYVNYNTQVSWTISARSINYPTRQLQIINAVMQPQPNSMTMAPNQTPVGQAGSQTINWLPQMNDPQQGTLVVIVRDLAFNQFETTHTFSWAISNNGNYANNNQTSLGKMLLGAGIGALSSVIGTGSLGNVFGGALAGLLASSGTGYANNPNVGGYAYNGGYNINYPNNPGNNYTYNSGIFGTSTAANTYGTYPGYGYPGLANGNRYGGYYNNAGYGYGAPGYNTNFNANGWTGNTGFFNFANNGYTNNGSNCAYGYGSAGYYNDYGMSRTNGSAYYYGNSNYNANTGYDNYSFGLADSGSSNLETWLAR